jgi:hypothetical protein
VSNAYERRIIMTALRKVGTVIHTIDEGRYRLFQIDPVKGMLISRRL